MYRMTVQEVNESNQQEEELDVDVEEEDANTEDVEDEPNIQSHQIVKETEDMIEINLSNDEESLKKTSGNDTKENSRTIFKRALINSNDQLVAATSAMANGASIIYISKVSYSFYPYYVFYALYNICMINDKIICYV